MMPVRVAACKASSTRGGEPRASRPDEETPPPSAREHPRVWRCPAPDPGMVRFEGHRFCLHPIEHPGCTERVLEKPRALVLAASLESPATEALPSSMLSSRLPSAMFPSHGLTDYPPFVRSDRVHPAVGDGYRRAPKGFRERHAPRAFPGDSPGYPCGVEMQRAGESSTRSR